MSICGRCKKRLTCWSPCYEREVELSGRKVQTAPAPPPQSTPPDVPQSDPVKKAYAPPGTTVTCGKCKRVLSIEEFLLHLEKCSECTIPKVPETPLPKYLDLIPMITKYIVKCEEGDGRPEEVAELICKCLAMPGQEDRKKDILSIRGYDSLFKTPPLVKIVNILERFPNLNVDEIGALLDIIAGAGMLTADEVKGLNSYTDLVPAVDEFRNHMAIQMSTKGRKWFLRFMRRIDEIAGDGVRHQIYTVRKANHELEMALNSKALKGKAVISPTGSPPRKRLHLRKMLNEFIKKNPCAIFKKRQILACIAQKVRSVRADSIDLLLTGLVRNKRIIRLRQGTYKFPLFTKER